MNPGEFRKIIREEVRDVVREEVSSIIEEKVPPMIDSRLSHHLGIMQEQFRHDFGLLNDKIDLNQEKNDRNFAEIREDISHIKSILDEHSMEIANLKNNNPVHSWRRS